MSSSVPKSKRVKRSPRLSLSDFTADEVSVIEAVKQSFSATEVVVFGSRARGDWAEDSDLDIGVRGYNPSLHRSLLTVLRDRLPIKLDLQKFDAALTHNGALVV